MILPSKLTAISHLKTNSLRIQRWTRCGLVISHHFQTGSPSLDLSSLSRRPFSLIHLLLFHRKILVEFVQCLLQRQARSTGLGANVVGHEDLLTLPITMLWKAVPRAMPACSSSGAVCSWSSFNSIKLTNVVKKVYSSSVVYVILALPICLQIYLSASALKWNLCFLLGPFRPIFTGELAGFVSMVVSGSRKRWDR